MRRALNSADEAVRALQDSPLDLRKIERVERSPAAQSLAEVHTRVLSMLTRREVEVLGLMAAGRTNQRIAGELVITAGAVKPVKRVLRKLPAGVRRSR